MKTAEIKKDFHKLIDSIKNAKMLAEFYDIISIRKDSVNGKLWNSLTKEQQEEILLADAETDNEMNLIPHKKVMKKHRKWLAK